MSNSKTILIDLSGTIHIGNKTTPQAVEALERLKKTPGVRVKFVTNTTKESRRILHSRLVKLGFNIDKDEIVSSLWAARELVKKESLRPFYLVDDDAMEDFEGLTGEDPSKADSVVVGLAPDKFDHAHLTTAFRILMSGGRLVAIHNAKYYMTEGESLALGPGAFVKTLEYSSGVNASIVGKPSADFYKMAIQPQTDTSNVIMIGDDVKQDVDGAQKIGIKGYLVKTGKYQPGDENTISPPPYQTVDSFASAVQHIIEQM